MGPNNILQVSSLYYSCPPLLMAPHLLVSDPQSCRASGEDEPLLFSGTIGPAGRKTYYASFRTFHGSTGFVLAFVLPFSAINMDCSRRPSRYLTAEEILELMNQADSDLSSLSDDDEDYQDNVELNDDDDDEDEDDDDISILDFNFK
ncbi:hypothetical protein AVEN_156930-1 [Araneus ventricosus]|uniref:Uncharacterized protein n=1 Tax=Araneus ventricosus TaxID=182803 RepID=A0A4Y2EPC1_ARAVE|nr:hypothetical protein AVEN_156930-1 [Araneus ventricosus]